MAERLTKVVVIVDNIGPYHVARFKMLSMYCDLQIIELFEASAEYRWARDRALTLEITTISDGQRSKQSIHRRIRMLLSGLRPDVVLIPGWSSSFSLCALAWCRKAGVPAVVMADSQEIDSSRSTIIESLKARIVRNFSAAFVAGSPHRRYLEELGMPHSFIREGYDAVDNDFFENGASRAAMNAPQLRDALDLPQYFFLSCSRFVEKKNITFLVRAYKIYRERMKAEFPTEDIWSLVLVGDGHLQQEIVKSVITQALEDCVKMTGYANYDALPNLYGLANAFVLASKTEQWGLVVNEAMASGLPVLVSRRCGCAENLVDEGINGWTFDPNDIVGLVDKMIVQTRIGVLESRSMGCRSREIIARYSIEEFCKRCMECISLSHSRERRAVGMWDRLLLMALVVWRGR